MNKISFLPALVVFAFLAACAGKPTHHPTPMPDPASFKAHFGDMDTGGDDEVDWNEFKAYFAHAEPEVFAAIDMNGDRVLDHDEWHVFKEAHGLKDHD